MVRKLRRDSRKVSCHCLVKYSANVGDSSAFLQNEKSARIRNEHRKADKEISLLTEPIFPLALLLQLSS